MRVFSWESMMFCRWVEYAEKTRYNASQVPAEWHGWLHFIIDLTGGELLLLKPKRYGAEHKENWDPQVEGEIGLIFTKTMIFCSNGYIILLDNDKNYCKMEIELKAQMIVRTEIMEMRSTSDAQLKDHVNNANKLQVYIQTFKYALGLQSLS
ncbi:hypothetical protein JHK87_049820 [Glycine soja]|nr:hypothetical protein JHK87_049820 [Glycine soja]